MLSILDLIGNCYGIDDNKGGTRITTDGCCRYYMCYDLDDGILLYSAVFEVGAGVRR
jgi:hypothetical protein